MLIGDGFWLGVGLVLGTVVGIVLGVRAHGSPTRRAALVLACAHLGAVLSVTLLPLPVGGAPSTAPFGNLQLVPFATIRLLFDGSQGLRQLGGNLLLLAPMGLLVPFAWARARPFATTVAIGLGASLLIELLQVVAGVLVGELYRVVDVDDVLLNTTGVVAGRILFGALQATWRVVDRGPRTDHGT